MPTDQPESGPRVAVVGCGTRGRALARAFRDLGALAAVGDAQAELAEDVARSSGVPARSVPEILADEGIAAVAVAAPEEQRFPLARDAMERGKHVLAAAPLTRPEAEELCRMAESGRRTLMVLQPPLYHPAFLTLRDMVSRGVLGRLRFIHASRLDRAAFRNAALDDVSMILSLTGGEPSQVLGTGIVAATAVHLEFPGGEQAQVFVAAPPLLKDGGTFVVIGDDGVAVFDDGEPWPSKLRHARHRIAEKDGHSLPATAEMDPVALDPQDPLRLACQHFLDCLRTGNRPRTDCREALKAVRTMEAVEMSMRTGQRVPMKGGPLDWRRADVFIHDTACIDAPVDIGPGTKIWHFSHVLSDVRIGRDCVIGQNAMIGPGVTVGDRCKIQNNVSIYKGVTLEDGVFCGPSCVFTNVLTPRAEVERKDEFAPTQVKRGASIGANATIVCGHVVGRYAMVAAGAVVSRDVPDHALVAGVPARQIGWVSRSGDRLGPDLVCPRTGERYREAPHGLEFVETESA